MAAAPIACGVAGWSYDDWVGYVYPPRTGDKLRYLAGYVDLIEINSTFYRVPSVRTACSWVERTADLPGFRFAAKVPSDLTHKGLQRVALDSTVARGFLESMRPLAEAGRLAHLLAQFRYDFEDAPSSRARLDTLATVFGPTAPLVLELRHVSWQAPDALDFLRGLGVAVAHLDYPLARDSFRMDLTGIGEHAYLRLHGRNAGAWFSRDAGRDETYNYLYAEDELDQIAGRAMRIAEMSKSLTLVANNHYQGKEAVNALEIKARVTGKPVDVPPQLLKKYPRLRQIARNVPGELDLGLDG